MAKSRDVVGSFIRHWNFTVFEYNLHYMIIWMTKSIVPHMYTIIYKIGLIDIVKKSLLKMNVEQNSQWT